MDVQVSVTIPGLAGAGFESKHTADMAAAECQA